VPARAKDTLTYKKRARETELVSALLFPSFEMKGREEESSRWAGQT